MKAITIKNPWASLICSGFKDVENRSRRTKFRGKILIHAGKQIDERFKLNSQQIEVFKINELEQLQNNDFTNSAIIGEVNIVDCIEDSDSIWSIQGQYHWILRDPVLYDEPIRNVKGKLGMWEFNAQSS